MVQRRRKLACDSALPSPAGIGVARDDSFAGFSVRIFPKIEDLTMCIPINQIGAILRADFQAAFWAIFTVGEAIRSTCGNSHEEEKEKNRFHLSLPQTIL